MNEQETEAIKQFYCLPVVDGFLNEWEPACWIAPSYWCMMFNEVVS